MGEFKANRWRRQRDTSARPGCIAGRMNPKGRIADRRDQFVSESGIDFGGGNWVRIIALVRTVDAKSRKDFRRWIDRAGAHWRIVPEQGTEQGIDGAVWTDTETGRKLGEKDSQEFPKEQEWARRAEASRPYVYSCWVEIWGGPSVLALLDGTARPSFVLEAQHYLNGPAAPRFEADDKPRGLMPVPAELRGRYRREIRIENETEAAEIIPPTLCAWRSAGVYTSFHWLIKPQWRKDGSDTREPDVEYRSQSFSSAAQAKAALKSGTVAWSKDRSLASHTVALAGGMEVELGTDSFIG